MNRNPCLPVAHRAVACLALSFLIVSTAQARQASPEIADAINTRLQDARSELIALHRDLHMHPETSGNEERTAARIADWMKRLGLEVRTDVGGHGVVALLRGGAPGPVVAFRADMDAVRTPSNDPAEYRSLTPGVRHHCRHDLHATIGVALAEALAPVREHISGTVMFIFQGAEESATGAGAMLADGVFDAVRPAAMFAYHTTPMQVGQFATATEALLPGRDRVVVTVKGRGAESTAGDVRDLLVRVGTVSQEEALTPTADDFIFSQVGRPVQRSGAWVVNATMTTASSAASASAKEQIERGLRELESRGVTSTLVYQEDWVAGVTNDPELVAFASERLQAAPGVERVAMIETMAPMFSEDFGRFQAVIPGVMFYFGVSNAEQGWVGMPHSDDFVADEEAIFVAARAMSEVLLGFLER